MSIKLEDEDDFTHYFNATRRLNTELAELRAAAQAVVNCPLLDNACEHIRTLRETLGNHKDG
jgi:hypothetical protein